LEKEIEKLDMEKAKLALEMVVLGLQKKHLSKLDYGERR
jgi:hypothetical protein